MDKGTDYARYRVVVRYHVEDNAVSNVKVTFDGTELTDSTSLGFLSPGDSDSVESEVSGYVRGSGEVHVSGTVKVTYTSSSGPPVPTSAGSEPTGGGTKEMEITKEYSTTIKLDDVIDPNKITVNVIPGETTIHEGGIMWFSRCMFSTVTVRP